MSNSLRLITENKHKVEIIKEAYDPSKPKTLKFRGIFLVAEKKNGNNRIYPYEELKREVDKFKVEMIDTNRALSELEHPDHAEIDPMRACARILSLEEDNKHWIGEAVILCSDEKHGVRGTPCGDVLASLAEYDTAFGCSSRCLGSIDEETGLVSDLHMVTIDTVMNPSIGEFTSNNASRFVNGILESKQWIVNNHGVLVESAYNKFEKRLSKRENTYVSSKKAMEAASALNDFFKSLTRI